MSRKKKSTYSPRKDITPEAVEIFKVQNRTKIVNSFFKYSFYSILAICLYLSVDSLAGKTTIAELIVNIFGNVTINRWAAYAIGGLGAGYGYVERKLRQKNIKRLSKRIIELESKVNRKRKSSNLSSIWTSPN